MLCSHCMISRYLITFHLFSRPNTCILEVDRRVFHQGHVIRSRCHVPTQASRWRRLRSPFLHCGSNPLRHLQRYSHSHPLLLLWGTGKTTPTSHPTPSHEMVPRVVETAGHCLHIPLLGLRPQTPNPKQGQSLRCLCHLHFYPQPGRSKPPNRKHLSPPLHSYN